MKNFPFIYFVANPPKLVPVSQMVLVSDPVKPDLLDFVEHDAAGLVDPEQSHTGGYDCQ